MIQIKAEQRSPAHDALMNDVTGSGSETPCGGRQTAHRARILRMQADWCVDMAAKVADPRLFRAYVSAASACQSQALSLEAGSAPENRAAMGVLTVPE